MPYIQTEGIAQGHANKKVPSIPDYSTISRRINKLDIKIENDNKSKEFKDDYIVIAIDSTVASKSRIEVNGCKINGK